MSYTFNKSIHLKDCTVNGKMFFFNGIKDTFTCGTGMFKQGRFVIYGNPLGLDSLVIVKAFSRYLLCQFIKAEIKKSNYKFTFDIVREIPLDELREQLP